MTVIYTCSHASPQVDFGRDPLGRQIFTLTNLEGDVYCASHGLSAPPSLLLHVPLLCCYLSHTSHISFF